MSHRAPAPVVDDRWNHDIAHHDVLLAAVPDGCRRALELGCGNGLLTRALAARCDAVTAVDLDPASVAATRAETAGLGHVTVVEGDLLTYPFDGELDLVVSVATLYHVDLEAGLRRMVELAAPGGVVGIVGLARSRSVWDLLHDCVGFVAHRVQRRRRGRRLWQPPVRMMDPITTYTDVLRTAATLMPGCRYRRHVLFRYSVVWTKPA